MPIKSSTIMLTGRRGACVIYNIPLHLSVSSEGDHDLIIIK